MTKREEELQKLFHHLQWGKAKVKSYFTYDGNKMEWTAHLDGDDEYITCHHFGQYAIRNNIRQFRWLLWSMLNIHGDIEWEVE